MSPCRSLLPLRVADHLVVREIYSDAVISAGNKFYTTEQIYAWEAMAWLPGVLDRPLHEGKGWLSLENQEVEAFALRYPPNRLALLYCRGRSHGRGHATVLIKHLQDEASNEGLTSLTTEASLFSYPLLLKLGWTSLFKEKVCLAGVTFERYSMRKELIS